MTVQSKQGEQRIAELEAENARLRKQLYTAVENVMQLDLLRRCHEDRTALKQELREAQAAARAFAWELQWIRDQYGSPTERARRVLAAHPGWLPAENGDAMVRLQQNDEAKHAD